MRKWFFVVKNTKTAKDHAEARQKSIDKGFDDAVSV
jgi:hypothetical protein